MKTYYVHYHDYGAPSPISGDTVLDAIESNFRSIAKRAEIGNGAGYQLDKVVVEYRPEVLGGKGGGALSITAHGSDFLRGYDPRTDAPQTTTLFIDGVTPEELPNQHIFELSDSDSEKHYAEHNPYNDPSDLIRAWGNITALMDDVGENHSRFPSNVSSSIDVKYPTVASVNPTLYMELLRQKMGQTKPLQDVATKKILSQIDKLALYIAEHSQEENSHAASNCIICRYQAAGWLSSQNRQTALAYYRNMAGLSARQLGEKVGLSDRQIRNYEQIPGSTLGNARASVVQSIADALGIPGSALVKGGLSVWVDSNGNEVE